MSRASNPAIPPPESLAKRLRHFAVGAVFALVLLVPKILHARRNPRSWMLFRIFWGVAGTALVVGPFSLGTSFVPAIIGLAMFIAAILLPPPKNIISVDDKAREMGAFVVVNGGRFNLGETSSFVAQLFVGAEHISVLDPHFQSFLNIPVSEITAAQAEEAHGRWFLRVDWGDNTAVFAYHGVFAEHLARVAESTIRGVLRPALPVLPQRRAAGA